LYAPSSSIPKCEILQILQMKNRLSADKNSGPIGHC
jgi:hypothetical protein